MKKIIFKGYLLFFSFLSFNHFYSIPTIHVFGDSHASFCFRERETIVQKDFLTFFHENNQILFPIKITFLFGVTMHRVGRDSLAFLNIADHGVKNEDTVVYVFGEVDVRCHIGKQRDQTKKDIDEIIDTLASNYIKTICENRREFKHIFSVVASVIPPIEGAGRTSPTYPFYGTLADRIIITQKLNIRLKELCVANNLIFLDIYHLFCTNEGSLNPELADAAVHINHIHNQLIKNLLIDLITK